MTTLGVTAAIGAPLTIYLWRIRRRNHEVGRGLAALAAMRWREFSGFVVEALHAQGFEADRLDSSPQSGQAADLKLTRNGESWLLSCKQGLNYRIDSTQIASLADAVRFAGASGGIVATLGSIQKEARTNNRGMELMDGPAVWELVEPLLPASLRDDLAEHAKRRSIGETLLAWVIALLTGGVVAFAISNGGGDTAAVPATDASTRAAQDASAPAVPTPAPPRDAATATPSDATTAAEPAQPASPAEAPALDETQQRREVVERVRQLPGVKRVAWSTRSTLLIDMDGSVADGPAFTRPICTVLEKYEALRASRLQLQPPEGSDARVRFMQCRTY
ncbi:restriction endonuclease [Marilutibacter chinensis]|uniref:Restriction endonuclease n=1 Tax=Marilutibacter chinensis TaxID=2912247 RepID=A0ABS9HPL3_9GAMM|nr:restriction endonuclease [Lysobacter chinensis]MCF7220568.1 restriction endonuclease [Lysobacter chinensis]